MKGKKAGPLSKCRHCGGKPIVLRNHRAKYAAYTERIPVCSQCGKRTP